MNSTIRYQAHCIWCGRDADDPARKVGRCARCGATLLFELDLEPRAAARSASATIARERKPRRRPLADPVET